MTRIQHDRNGAARLMLHVADNAGDRIVFRLRGCDRAQRDQFRRAVNVNVPANANAEQANRVIQDAAA